jgi:hypothetical protein|tara:strand:- start:20 stop:292 length:273 start_codon:yes stop_codon:yes gene_type:complete
MIDKEDISQLRDSKENSDDEQELTEEILDEIDADSVGDTHDAWGNVLIISENEGGVSDEEIATKLLDENADWDDDDNNIVDTVGDTIVEE